MKKILIRYIYNVEKMENKRVTKKRFFYSIFQLKSHFIFLNYLDYDLRIISPNNKFKNNNVIFFLR